MNPSVAKEPDAIGPVAINPLFNQTAIPADSVITKQRTDQVVNQSHFSVEHDILSWRFGATFPLALSMANLANKVVRGELCGQLRGRIAMATF